LAVRSNGGLWTDGLVIRRQIRKIKLVEKLHHAIEKAGFEPRTIPDNIWVPAIQEALLQDDKTIQDIWANLLANSADPRRGSPVYPSFVLMAKELTAREAKFLNKLSDQSKSPNLYKTHVESIFTEDELMKAYSDAGLTRFPKSDGSEQAPRLSPLKIIEIERKGYPMKDYIEFAFALALLIRLGLLRLLVETEPLDVTSITHERGVDPLRRLDISTSTQYIFTELAVQFVNACRAPA
jgi:chorismate mutase